MAMFIYQVASPRKPQAHVVIYREELCGNLIVEAAVIQEVFACFSISAPTGGCLARVAPPNRCSGTHPLTRIFAVFHARPPARFVFLPGPSCACVVARSCLPDSLRPSPHTLPFPSPLLHVLKLPRVSLTCSYLLEPRYATSTPGRSRRRPISDASITVRSSQVVP